MKNRVFYLEVAHQMVAGSKMTPETLPGPGAVLTPRVLPKSAFHRPLSWHRFLTVNGLTCF